MIISGINRATALMCVQMRMKAFRGVKCERHIAQGKHRNVSRHAKRAIKSDVKVTRTNKRWAQE